MTSVPACENCRRSTSGDCGQHNPAWHPLLAEDVQHVVFWEGPHR